MSSGPPSKLTVALLVVVGLLFVGWVATPIVAEFIGATLREVGRP